jgi:hypothetical protein
LVTNYELNLLTFPTVFSLKIDWIWYNIRMECKIRKDGSYIARLWEVSNPFQDGNFEAIHSDIVDVVVAGTITEKTLLVRPGELDSVMVDNHLYTLEHGV